MNITHNDDGTYTVSFTVTISRTGRTPQEAYLLIREFSDEGRLYLMQHPEFIDQLMQEYGPKTDEEKYKLFKSVIGQE